MSYLDWRSAVLERGASSPLQPFFPIFSTEQDRREPTLMRLPRFDCRNVEEGLEGLGIQCPPVDAELLRCNVDAFARAGLLPSPRSL
jgi:hypothetical protein